MNKTEDDELDASELTAEELKTMDGEENISPFNPISVKDDAEVLLEM